MNIKIIFNYFLFQIAQLAFKNTKALNRIQSVVFDAAYKTNENLLICAPTGAGKTNIAMLTILHEMKQHISQGVIKKDEFKVSLFLIVHKWLEIRKIVVMHVIAVICDNSLDLKEVNTPSKS